jgi:hypothetical protein
MAVQPKTSPRSSFEDASRAAANQVDTNSIVDQQISILRRSADSPHTPPKQLQATYNSTIIICAVNGRDKETLELIRESEQRNVFQDAPEVRAGLYSMAIRKLVEKGFHVKGDELYKEASGAGVWKDFPAVESTVRGELEAVGFKYH